MHIGYRTPSWYDDMDAMERMSAITRGAGLAHLAERPSVCDPEFWTSLGIRPVWSDEDTSVCVAAVDPGVDGSDTDLQRLIAGAIARDENVVIVSTLSAARPGVRRRPLWGGHGVRINGAEFRGRLLPAGVEPRTIPDLDAVDRDLGLRLHGYAGPWWEIEIDQDPDDEHEGDPSASMRADLVPILETAAGEVVAGFVELADGDRWYIVPDLHGDQVPRWLLDVAMPQFVPEAVQRARAAHLVDPSLRTNEERMAIEQRDRFQEQTQRELETLTAAIDDAERAASEVREALLYASSDALVDAVGWVMGAAGFVVERLDDQYGTTTADLLLSFSGRHWLVEVRSAGGHPGENAVQDLRRHVQTFPQIDSRPVERGVLVVSNHTKLAPRERPVPIYTSRPFIESLDVVVIACMTIFDWWRNEAWDELRAAVTGPPGQR